MPGMKVDFNNLRRRTCDEFDALVKSLRPLEKNRNADGSRMDANELSRLAHRLNDLGASIAAIALCYDEHGNEDVLGKRDLLFLNIEED